MIGLYNVIPPLICEEVYSETVQYKNVKCWYNYWITFICCLNFDLKYQNLHSLRSFHTDKKNMESLMPGVVNLPPLLSSCVCCRAFGCVQNIFCTFCQPSQPSFSGSSWLRICIFWCKKCFIRRHCIYIYVKYMKYHSLFKDGCIINIHIICNTHIYNTINTYKASPALQRWKIILNKNKSQNYKDEKQS